MSACTYYYYPARYLASHETAEAALASIGCEGEDADTVVSNALIEQSPHIAVGVVSPDGMKATALICETPDGRHQVWIGMPDFATSDRRKAEKELREIKRRIGGVWSLNEWIRRSECTQ